MEVGDTFTITILNREITYEVDDISIVLPDETDSLQIEDKKDYCTLMTCTPYGINTHRLLVRGHCIGTENRSISMLQQKRSRLTRQSRHPLWELFFLSCF